MVPACATEFTARVFVFKTNIDPLLVVKIEFTVIDPLAVQREVVFDNVKLS